MKDTVAYTLEKGRPLIATIAATAGNVAYSLSPGSGYKIKIMYGQFVLVTNATVADRYLSITITTTGGLVLAAFGANGTAQTATQTKTYDLVPFYDAVSNTHYWGILASSGQLAYSQPIEIYDTDVFKITIIAGVAGDSYSGRIKYLLVKR